MPSYSVERSKRIKKRIEQFKDTHERLKGATVEYHKEKEVCPDCDCTLGLGDDCDRCNTSDDRYILHGVLARLQSAWICYDYEVDKALPLEVVVEELINTLQAYLSQG